MGVEYIITAFVGIIGAIGGALVTGAFNRRKIQAEAENIVLDNYRKLIDELQQEVARLRQQVEAFDGTARQIREFHDNEIQRLESRYTAQIAVLTTRVSELEAENEALANTQENNNAQTMKLQYAFVILMDQVRQLDREPVVDLALIEEMTVEELRRIANGIGNANDRRKRRQAELRNQMETDSE